MHVKTNSGTIVNLMPPRVIAEVNITLDISDAPDSDIEKNFLAEVGAVLAKLQQAGDILDYSVHVDRNADNEEDGEVTWIGTESGESAE